MANDGTDIDLYADDLEFNQDTEFNDQNLDLYDDVITPSGKNSNSNSNNPLHEDDFTSNQDSNNAQNIENVSNSVNENQNNLSATTKKIGIYVGNLTWWTTDQDIIESINGIGVTDIIEVKFFENRANGQSKGFCVVSLGSEGSVKNVIEKLPKTEIHAQNPVVTPCNKQNLNHFEMQSRKNNPGHANNNNNSMNNGNNLNNNMNNVNNGPSQMRPPYGGNPLMSGSNSGHMRPPLINRPQRPNGPLLQSQPRMQLGGLTPQGPYGQGMQNQNLWNHQMGPQSGNGAGPPNNRNPRGGPMHGSPQGGPRPGLGGPMNMRMPNSGGLQRNSSQPLLRAPGPPSDRLGHNGQMGQDWDHGVHGSVMPPGPGPMNQSNPMNLDQGMHGGPAPHVNPAFFGGPGQAQDPYSRSSGAGPPYSNEYGRPPLNPGGSDSSLMMQLSESEFEELLSKNRNVSSNAISRAVADASVGDFSSAIETLVTAISLIKQSKVANDERCKILISSLQDTLHGIETKSYSSSRKDRPRSRERDRSRDRSRRDKRRDRSRSRDYRSRSREKRGRDRDRERDYRRERSRDRYRPERDYYREDPKNEK